jgi:aminobenzoyl-glutamate utilization protein B
MDYLHLKEMVEYGDSMAKGAAIQTGTQYTKRTLGSAWPPHFNKVVAEAQQKNIEAVGMPVWTAADQKLAQALQAELGVSPAAGLKTTPAAFQATPGTESTGSDDVGDISWNLPTVYLSYPANIPGLPGHHWANAVAMATPIAHKGSAVGAKVQAMTALDLLLTPKLVAEAWAYFREVQTKVQQYTPLIDPQDQPATFLNREKMERFRPQMRKFYYDPSRYKTYLEQLGIGYPTVR